MNKPPIDFNFLDKHIQAMRAVEIPDPVIIPTLEFNIKNYRNLSHRRKVGAKRNARAIKELLEPYLGEVLELSERKYKESLINGCTVVTDEEIKELLS